MKLTLQTGLIAHVFALMVMSASIGQVEAAEQGSAKAKTDKFKHTLNLETKFDDWSNNLSPGNEGTVLSQHAKYSLNYTPASEAYGLSIKLTNLYGYSELENDGVSASDSGLGDTKLTGSLELGRKGSWSSLYSLSLNLPTGKTEATQLELSAKPTHGINSGNFLGKGFDVGGDAKFCTNSCTNPTSHGFFIGGGLSRIGAYDGTADPTDDDVAGGTQVRLVAGLNHLEFWRVRAGFAGEFKRTEGVAGSDGNFVMGRANIKYPQDGKIVFRGVYEITASDNAPAGASVAIRQEEFQKGIKNKFSGALEFDYRTKPSEGKPYDGGWMGQISVTSTISDQEKPLDSTFFTTKSSLSVGGEAQFLLSESTSLKGAATYRRERSEKSDGAETDFSGYTFVAGIKFSF